MTKDFLRISHSFFTKRASDENIRENALTLWFHIFVETTQSFSCHLTASETDDLQHSLSVAKSSLEGFKSFVSRVESLWWASINIGYPSESFVLSNWASRFVLQHGANKTFATVCMFLKHTTQNDLDEEPMFNDWILGDSFEYNYSTNALNVLFKNICQRENITLDRLKTFMNGYHSSGSAYDSGKDLFQKITDLVVTPITSRFYEAFDLYEDIPRLDVSEYDQPAKWITVPKSYKTRRPITVEPTSMKFAQSLAKTAIDGVFFDNPRSEIYRHCNLRSTDPQRELVRRGSIDGKLATIDLSSASDRISLKLLEGVFSGTPFEKFLSLRTPLLTYKGNHFFVEKFGGMGNMLTFPFETILFYLIGKKALIDSGVDRRKTDLRVYGDDIIIETEAVPRLYELLETYELWVNKDKSFSQGRFRESCGHFYYNGQNVTPLQIPRKFTSFSGDYESCVQLDAFIGSLIAHGFIDTALKLVKIMNSRKLFSFSWYDFDPTDQFQHRMISNWKPLAPLPKGKRCFQVPTVSWPCQTQERRKPDDTCESKLLEYWLYVTRNRDRVSFPIQIPHSLVSRKRTRKAKRVLKDK